MKPESAASSTLQFVISHFVNVTRICAPLQFCVGDIVFQTSFVFLIREKVHLWGFMKSFHKKYITQVNKAGTVLTQPDSHVLRVFEKLNVRSQTIFSSRTVTSASPSGTL